MRLAATFAVCSLDERLVTPPVARVRSAAGSVFPLRLGGQPVRALRNLRQPGYVLLNVIPTKISGGCPIITARLVTACLTRKTLSPFTNGHRKAADCKWLDRDLMDWPLARVFVAAHHERAAGELC